MTLHAWVVVRTAFCICFGATTAIAACPAGQLECGNGCIPAGHVCCNSGSYCEPGYMCTRDGTCLAKTSDRVCGNGRYCERGYRCVREDRCQRVDAPGAGEHKHALDNRIANSCLEVGKTRVITASSRCNRKDGTKSHWHLTHVKSSGAEGCPRRIGFDYLDRDTGTVLKGFTPMNIKICGDRPAALETVK
jgi:hypothetical protein